MRARIPLGVLERTKRRVAAMKPPDKTSFAEAAVRKQFKQLMRLRKSGNEWDVIVLEVFGTKRPPGLSPRNVYRLLRKIAGEQGILLERLKSQS